MKKAFAGLLLSIILLAPSLSHAQTATTATLEAQYRAALIQLIQLLTQRVELLQAQLAAQITAGQGDQTVTIPGESDGVLTVTTVPLLSGGTARTGTDVPVSYLQLRNSGDEAAHISGFWVKQNGSAPSSVVRQLTTVDDKGGSRGASGLSPFDGSVAFAPTDATIAAGGLKLFTIKAVIGNNIASHLLKDLKIDVTGVESNGTVKGSFPLRGTIWTLSL